MCIVSSQKKKNTHKQKTVWAKQCMSVILMWFISSYFIETNEESLSIRIFIGLSNMNKINHKLTYNIFFTKRESSQRPSKDNFHFHKIVSFYLFLLWYSSKVVFTSQTKVSSHCIHVLHSQGKVRFYHFSVE